MLRDGYFLTHRAGGCAVAAQSTAAGLAVRVGSGRRHRVRRPGAAPLARGASARADHRGDVVVARRPRAHAAGARKDLGRRRSSRSRLTKLAEQADVVFLALPEEAAAAIAPALVDRGVRVIDLSGAFGCATTRRARSGIRRRSWAR